MISSMISNLHFHKECICIYRKEIDYAVVLTGVQLGYLLTIIYIIYNVIITIKLATYTRFSVMEGRNWYTVGHGTSDKGHNSNFHTKDTGDPYFPSSSMSLYREVPMYYYL